MALIKSKFALVAVALLSSTPLATSQNSPNENLVLADCGIGLGENGGSTSREAIYYNGDVWTGSGENTNNPTMMVNVPWSGQYPWTQQGGLGFTMPNNDFFAILIDASVKDPNEAGIAYHSYEPKHQLTCYSYHRDRVFQLADGKWCSSAYVCNHRGQAYVGDGQTKPEPQELKIFGSVNNDTVEFYNKPATLIMNTARDAFLKNGAACDTTKRSISDKCTIKWECTGDPASNSLERMASVFDELAKNDKFTKKREVTTDTCRQWDTRPGNKGECLLWTQKTDRYYKIPGTIDLTMRNMARPGDNSNVHAWLRYTIECEAPTTWECVLCNTIGTALTVNVPAAGAAVLIGCLHCGN
jgi:hypothetical protein